MKCGNCHANKSVASSQPPALEPSAAKRSSRQVPSAVALSPAAAAQPISGGMPPTMAPTHVLIAETLFSGV